MEATVANHGVMLPYLEDKSNVLRNESSLYNFNYNFASNQNFFYKRNSPVTETLFIHPLN